MKMSFEAECPQYKQIHCNLEPTWDMPLIFMEKFALKMQSPNTPVLFVICTCATLHSIVVGIVALRIYDYVQPDTLLNQIRIFYMLPLSTY